MVIFVGDKPSRLNTDPRTAFVGTPSFRNLFRWIDKLDITTYTMINSYTHDDFLEICQYFNMGYKQFVALGNKASEELDALKIPHFKLPHPSPRNRKLNDKEYIDQEIHKCYHYLKGMRKCV